MSNYIPKENIQDFLNRVGETYTDEEHVINEEVQMMLDKTFVWKVCYDLSTIDNFVVGNHPTNAQCTWTLYAKVRAHGSKYRARSPCNDKKLLTVKKSMILDAGLGCFADRTIMEEEKITIYMGAKKKVTSMPTHKKNPYAVFLKRNEILVPCGRGSALHLGAHKANDMNFNSGRKKTGKKGGKPP